MATLAAVRAICEFSSGWCSHPWRTTPKTPGEQLGSLPQAFAHLALIDSALALDGERRAT